ncbi:hypothetical protein [Yoonia sp. 2307UL14-13]|uniref:hypothetical protein n=1 Tax=Yoonia sp. 2307UL14-13 TaxID=3126506 RepID=UPI0030A41492
MAPQSARKMSPVGRTSNFTYREMLNVNFPKNTSCRTTSRQKAFWMRPRRVTENYLSSGAAGTALVLDEKTVSKGSFGKGIFDEFHGKFVCPYRTFYGIK